MNENQIKHIFQQHKWYLSWKQIEESKISQYSINKLIKSNKILKIQNGLYKWKKFDSADDELIDISYIQPEGVFCLYTALNFYNLTSFMPKFYYIAIPRQNRIKKGLENYPIEVKKWLPKYFNLGIDRIKLGNYTIRMYNIEKTICDSIRYRNQIGLFIIKEILTTYINSDKKNIPKLNKYAKEMKIDKILKNFMGMII